MSESEYKVGVPTFFLKEMWPLSRLIVHQGKGSTELEHSPQDGPYF